MYIHLALGINCCSFAPTRLSLFLCIYVDACLLCLCLRVLACVFPIIVYVVCVICVLIVSTSQTNQNTGTPERAHQLQGQGNPRRRRRPFGGNCSPRRRAGRSCRPKSRGQLCHVRYWESSPVVSYRIFTDIGDVSLGFFCLRIERFIDRFLDII